MKNELTPNTPTYKAYISKPTKNKQEILECCKNINFMPKPAALDILTNYGNIVIGKTKIFGFADRQTKDKNGFTTTIEIATNYEQTKGLPQGYIVIQRFAIGKCRPYQLTIMDENGTLYQCDLNKGEILQHTIKPIRKTFNEYIIETFHKTVNEYIIETFQQ